MLKHDSPVNFFLFYAANFFFSAAYYILFPIIPVHAHGIKAGVLGVLPITITYFFALIVAAPIVGYFIDWKGRLRFVLLGAFAGVVFAVAYIFVKSTFLLILLRFFHGIFTAFFFVGMLTILSDATENLWRAEIISSFLLPQLFWIAVGPAFALFLLPYGGAKTVFIAAAIFFAFGFIFSSFIKRPKLFSLAKENINIAELLTFDNLLILSSVFIFSAVYSAVLWNANLHISGAKGDALGGFYTWFVVAGMLVMYNSGNLSDRIGRANSAFVGFLFLLISLVTLLFTDQKPTANLAGIFFGISYGLIMPTLLTWWMDVVPLTKRGISMGVYQSVQGIGLVIGLWILNIFGLIGVKGIFSAAIVLVFAVFIALGYRQWPELRTKFK